MLVIQIFFTPHCYITDYYDYWQKKKKTHTKQKKTKNYLEYSGDNLNEPRSQWLSIK